MADATKLPTLAEFAYYQFSRKGSPAPKLAAPLSALTTDVTVQFTHPLLDENGTVVTRAFLLGIKKANGWVETCYCAAGNLSADGLTATVVRGIDPGGLDYSAGSASFADSHLQDEPIFCNIPAQIMALLTSALQGTIATGGAGFTIGTDAAGTVTIYRSTGTGTKTGVFRWNTGNSKAEYSNNGVTWNSIDSVTASNLLIVTASDTTPSNLNAKTGSGTGITRTVTNPGANEVLTFSVNGTLAALISDVTATATEINQVTDGVSANVTAANLTTLTGGGDASTLHTHSGGQLGYTNGVLGEAFSASDITNNLNLAYQNLSDGKWYKVTSSAATWYKRLGIVTTAGVLDAQVLILLQGVVSKSFSNINPTFSSALTGTPNYVGDSNANSARAFVISNTSGAECVVTGGTISARQHGTPAGAMLLYLVLEQQETTDSPACFKDTTNNVVRGAIIASATIAQALFSGTYAALAFTFGANVKIPAGAKVYLVISQTGAISGANYYDVQSNAQTKALDQSTETWSGTANAGNLTLTVTSTSPVGYAVKAYAGSNGSYGLTPTNPWSRALGTVISTTQFYFDPTPQLETVINISRKLIADNTSGFSQATLNFCPSFLNMAVVSRMDADTDLLAFRWGHVRGDSSEASSFRIEAIGDSSNNLDDYLGGRVAGSGDQADRMAVGAGNGFRTQNQLYAARLEDGFYLYTGYPTGANFISAGKAGFVDVRYGCHITCT